MDDTWIVVADAATARIFATDAEMNVLSEVAVVPHAASRAKTSELVSDQPGRTAYGASRSGMAKGDPHELEELRAAHLLASYLDDAHVHHKFRDLVLVASPVFLGRLRGELGRQTQKAVTASVDRDYTTKPRDEIRDLVKARLQEQPLPR